MLSNHRRSPHREAVEVKEKRFGYFPQVFRWRGKQYNVQQVEQCWTSIRRPHLCFRVRCDEGRFDLYQNVRDNTWHLVGVSA